jgi:hypothetical protein
VWRRNKPKTGSFSGGGDVHSVTVIVFILLLVCCDVRCWANNIET